jgi:hypothetical protein
MSPAASIAAMAIRVAGLRDAFLCDGRGGRGGRGGREERAEGVRLED